MILAIKTRGERLFVHGKVPAQSSGEFIAFWPWLYPDQIEPMYTENIGKPLNPERIHELFTWKFPRFARHRRPFIDDEFVSRMHTPTRDADPRTYLAPFRSVGSPIWCLFWLHCSSPDRFPIYDQHVHRAMTFIETGELVFNPQTTIDSYLDHYLKFHKQFDGIAPRGSYGRDVDRALWTFGKTIGHRPWNLLAAGDRLGEDGGQKDP